MERIPNGRYTQEFREELVKMAMEKVLIIDVDRSILQCGYGREFYRTGCTASRRKDYQPGTSL
jgi:hypothetical protein